jgi:phosphoribosylformimino-5-aminoimidazole carboxamide ribonucleotide (ProFAR) isomerase
MSISALCFFNVSNRYTFSILHEVDMAAAKTTARRRETVVELILRSVAL